MKCKGVSYTTNNEQLANVENEKERERVCDVLCNDVEEASLTGCCLLRHIHCAEQYKEHNRHRQR